MLTYLIIRAEDDARKTAGIFRNEGVETIVEPIFSVENLVVNVENKNPQALVITSSNACDAIINSGFALNIKIFAIGHRSAQKLLERGYNNIFYPEINSAEGLKNLIIANLPTQQGEIIYFCGDFITLDFKLELEPLGFTVVKILAYKVKWNENFSAEFLKKTQEKQIDFILFYSKNSVKKFYELAKNNNLLEYFGNSRLLCLSDKIAATAKELGFKNLGNFNEIPTLKK